MKIGCPKEIKVHEYRVGLVPAGVRELVADGHEVFIQTQAGSGIGIDDDAYVAAGAKILGSAREVFDTADMVVKVKEPQPIECGMLRQGQVLFTYLHLAADPRQAEGLVNSGCTAIAYETVVADRSLPLLTPMSEVAGRMSIQVGATALQKAYGGFGVLLGGVPGVPPARVVVVGGGVVGTQAARMAAGLGAEVTVLDRSLPRLRQLLKRRTRRPGGRRSSARKAARSARSGTRRHTRRDRSPRSPCKRRGRRWGRRRSAVGCPRTRHRHSRNPRHKPGRR